MAIGGIRQETGRATYDEILRLRRRVDNIERYRNSETQALASTGSGTGPVGSYAANDLRYLKLNADNDPLTGSLEALAITLNSGDLTVAAGNQVITAGNLTLDAGIVSVTRSGGTGLSVIVTSTDSAVVLNMNSQAAPVLAPDAVTNPEGTLRCWWETDSLTTFSDGDDLPGWTNEGLVGPDIRNLVQNSASARPHYRSHADYQTPTGKAGVIAESTSHNFAKVSGGFDWTTGGGDTSAFIVVYRTDDAAGSNNVMTMGNDGTSAKQSFRPVGNADLGNSYFYDNTNTLRQIGTGHPGNAGGTWHIALFTYNQTGDDWRIWIDGTEYDNALSGNFTVSPNTLFFDRDGGGSEGVAVGTGVAAICLYGNQTGAELDLDEVQQVHDYIALEYMGAAYQIAASGSGGNILEMQSAGVAKTVFDETGQLHIGGTDPAAALDVEGDAEISGYVTVGTTASITGQLTAGSLEVSGLTTLSGVDAGAATLDSLTVDGLVAINHQTVTIVGSSGPSLHMTGPGPNFAWIEDNHTTQSDWRMRLNAGQLEWRDNVGASGINTVMTFEPGAPTDAWTFQNDGNIKIQADAGLIFGGGGDASIEYDGTDLIIDARLVGSGDTIIKGTSTWYTRVSGANGNLTVQNTGPQVILSEVSFTTLSQVALRQDAGILDVLDQSTGVNNAIIRIYTKASAAANSAGAFKFLADDFYLDNDNGEIIFGEGADASISYNGIDMLIKPKRVGSGHVDIRGTLEKEERVVSKSAAYTLDPADNYCLVSADAVITLPTASQLSQQNVKNITAGALVQVIGQSGATIDGNTTITVPYLHNMKFVTDGTNWYIV